MSRSSGVSLGSKRREPPVAAVGRDSVFQDEFRDDLRHWATTDRKVALRMLDLVEAVMRDPVSGIGKPEPLRHLGAHVWSRRITQEHRFVYLIGDRRVDFLMCRYHY